MFKGDSLKLQHVRIPGYNLQMCHERIEETYPETWDKITVVGYTQAFKSLFHTLYDEDTGKYVSFGLASFLGLEA